MFLSTVQSSTVSLFSSTSSDPLALFSTHVDLSLPSDSFIHLLNDTSAEPPPPPPACLIPPSSPDPSSPNYTLDQTVLHIQSPSLPKTFIQSPPRTNTSFSELGLKHPWLHLQVRNLKKQWSFEVGLVDRLGRTGVLRLSTFQRNPRLKICEDSPPILHLPLTFPALSSSPTLTTWSTVSVHLPPYLPQFSSPALLKSLDDNETDESALPGIQVPFGSYSHVSYVRVYATCRLRRIWFSENEYLQRLPWEFELYGDG